MHTIAIKDIDFCQIVAESTLNFRKEIFQIGFELDINKGLDETTFWSFGFFLFILKIIIIFIIILITFTILFIFFKLFFVR